MRRMFTVSLSVDIAIDEALVAAVLDPKWRATYSSLLRTPEDVARHLAAQLAAGRIVSDIVGFANWPADAAIVSNIEATGAVELRKGARHE